MKNRIKQFYLCLALLLTAGCGHVFAGVEWFTDLNQALAKAQKENKTVLLDFTGSDWCGWCMKLKREVFDQPDFAAYAGANLVMVEVDFPREKEISDSQKQANEALARKFSIRGYPTLILLDSHGEQVGKGGYVPGGPQNFIAALETNPKFGHHKAPPPEIAKKEEPAESPKAILRLEPPTQDVPIKYGDLALKAISGAKDHRMALINNTTLMAGETGRVKIHDQQVIITMQEIRDDSVLIKVAGKTAELRFAKHDN